MEFTQVWKTEFCGTFSRELSNKRNFESGIFSIFFYKECFKVKIGKITQMLKN